MNILSITLALVLAFVVGSIIGVIALAFMMRDTLEETTFELECSRETLEEIEKRYLKEDKAE